MWKEMCKSRTEAGDRCVGWWLHSCIDGVIYIVEKEGLLADGSRCVGAPAKDALHTERVQGRGAVLPGDQALRERGTGSSQYALTPGAGDTSHVQSVCQFTPHLSESTPRPLLRCYRCSVAKPCLALGDPVNVACQAPLSMGFPRQEYWSGLPFPAPGHLPDPGIEPTAPSWEADSLPLSHLEAHG